MTNTLLFCVLLFSIVALAQNSSVAVGIARIRGTNYDPTVDGIVTFTQVGDMVNMSVYIHGVTSNLGVNHGIHLHEFGDLDFLGANTGSTVGGHWNPHALTHGCPENGPVRHLGDTGNWMVQLDGTVVGWKLIDIMALTGNDSVVGFAVIFHNQTDDCANVPSSGVRLAQGVIGVANPTYYGGTQNTALPTNYYTNITSGICNFLNATGASSITGWVRFTQASPTAPTVVTALINGLTLDTKHGFHVHQYGDFFLNDATSSGGHYTGPVYDSTSTHSIPGSGLPSHVGDMGNLYYYSSGVAFYNNSFTQFGLYGAVNSVIGRAVVLHANADNCSQPLGAAGARLAICIIGPMNPTNDGNYVIPIGVSVPSTQNVDACPISPTTSTTSGNTTDTTTGTSGNTTTTTTGTTSGNTTDTTTGTTSGNTTDTTTGTSGNTTGTTGNTTGTTGTTGTGSTESSEDSEDSYGGKTGVLVVLVLLCLQL